MSFNVIVRHEAELDLIDAVKWYEENLKGLGSNFLLNVEATIQSLSRNPQAYPKVYKNIRRALIRKFPFGIHYIIEGNQIVVLAIFHFSRSPKNWKSRIQ
jgi:plasmid stabilization system protein ParE